MEFQQKRQNIRLEWVPAHAGIELNERADQLAKAGTARAQKGIESEEWEDL